MENQIGRLPLPDLGRELADGAHVPRQPRDGQFPVSSARAGPAGARPLAALRRELIAFGAEREPVRAIGPLESRRFRVAAHEGGERLDEPVGDPMLHMGRHFGPLGAGPAQGRDLAGELRQRERPHAGLPGRLARLRRRLAPGALFLFATPHRGAQLFLALLRPWALGLVPLRLAAPHRAAEAAPVGGDDLARLCLGPVPYGIGNHTRVDGRRRAGPLAAAAVGVVA